MKKLTILLVTLMLLCSSVVAQNTTRESIRDVYLRGLLVKLLDISVQVGNLAMDMTEDLTGAAEERYSSADLLSFTQSRIAGLAGLSNELFEYVGTVCQTLGISLEELVDLMTDDFEYFMLGKY